jgi:hypothetical protein
MTYTDVLYDKKAGVAWITINRPEVRNAFRTRTVQSVALKAVAGDPSHRAEADAGLVDEAQGQRHLRLPALRALAQRFKVCEPEAPVLFVE